MMGRDQAFALHMMQQIYEQAIMVLVEGDIDFGHYDAEVDVFLQQARLSDLPWGADVTKQATRYAALRPVDAEKVQMELPSTLFEQLDHHDSLLSAYLMYLREDGVAEALLEGEGLARALLRYHECYRILGEDAVFTLEDELSFPFWSALHVDAEEVPS